MKKQKIFIETRDDLSPDDRIFEALRRYCIIVKNPESADTIVAIGGDGTLNTCIRKYWRHHKQFFGWHRGGKDSVGFHLTPITPKYVYEFLKREIDKFKMYLMKIEMHDKYGNYIGKKYAYGDCFFSHAGGGIINAQLDIDGELWKDPIGADGVLVATGAGSTAYNASINGPIKKLYSRGLIVNAISPLPHFHWRPRALDDNEYVVIKLVNTERRPGKLFVDGREVDLPVKAINVTQTDLYVTLGFSRSYKYKQRLVNW